MAWRGVADLWLRASRHWAWLVAHLAGGQQHTVLEGALRAYPRPVLVFGTGSVARRGSQRANAAAEIPGRHAALAALLGAGGGSGVRASGRGGIGGRKGQRAILSGPPKRGQ